ncbi:hypothetical protein Tco_1426895 [Tanacetum coccineum]
MSEEDQAVGTTVLPKFDMPSYESTMTTKDVKSLALRHGIPLDLHPVALTKGWTMDKLPDDMIGLYEQYFEFSGIRVPFSAFLLAVIKHFRVHISQLVSLGLNRLTMFELYCRSLDIVPSVNLFRGGLATTWDFSGFRPIFKDTEGNVVTVSEYLRFPFLSGASISKGPVLTPQDQIPQHTTRPLPKARAAARKKEKRRQGGDGGEGSRPETKRKKIARKDGSAASEATSSPKPLQTVNPIDPSGAIAETAESREDRSPRISSHIGTSGDQSGKAATNVNTEVVQPSLIHQFTYHIPMATQPTSPPRSIQRGNVEEGESSRGRALYLMVHLAPPTTQEEFNALNNATALERAWFYLARGALAQTDILERFEHLQANFDKLAETHSECEETVGKLVQARLDLVHNSHLYTTLSDRYKTVKSEHEGCAGKLEVLESRNSKLYQVNKDQALQIKEFE